MNNGARERALSFRRELTRKALHLSSATIPIALASGATRAVTLPVLGVLAVAAIMVEIMRAMSPTAASRFEASVRPLLRPHEAQRITGATWLIVSMFAAVLLLPRNIAIAATWAAAVGDAAAALIGMRFGRLRSYRDGKSLEGSGACLIATFIGAVTLAHLAFTVALLASLAATIGERLPWPRDDNARIIALVSIIVLIAAAL